jgi:DNA-binding GntR family transcriptional regulator
MATTKATARAGGGRAALQRHAGKPAARGAPALPADAVSSPDAIFQEILRGLYEGRYVPGQRLIESDLTRRFKVSRGSVREAMKRLAAEGVVKLTLHKGAYIRTLSRADVRAILLVIEVMIGLAARLAAEQIDDEGRQALRDSYARLLSFRENANFPEFVRARNAYYRTLVRLGGNQELGRLLPSMHVHLVRIQFRPYPVAAEETRFEDYQQMTDAVLRGDATAAEKAGRAHIRRILRSIDQLPDEAFPADD